MATRHGNTTDPLFKTWYGIITRCERSSHRNFRHYGGRGISICKEWKDDFRAFKAWAIENGWAPGLEIDRIDNDGNYEPGNCRCVTHIVNCNNQRTSRIVTIDGETGTVSDLARRMKVPYTTLRGKVNRTFGHRRSNQNVG